MIRASGSCRRTLMMTISIHVCKNKVMMILIDMMIVIDIHDDSSHNDVMTVIVMMIIIFEHNNNYSHDVTHDIHDDNQNIHSQNSRYHYHCQIKDASSSVTAVLRIISLYQQCMGQL